MNADTQWLLTQQTQFVFGWYAASRHQACNSLHPEYIRGYKHFKEKV